MSWKTKLWLIATIATTISSHITESASLEQQNTQQESVNNVNASKIVTKLLANDLENDLTGLEPTSNEIGNSGENPTFPLESQEGANTNSSVEIANSEELITEGPGGEGPAASEEELSSENNTDPVEEDILVETTNGPVHGYYWQESQEIIAFLDIPYGKFDSNFGAPSEPDSWTEPLQVKEHTRRCPQLDTEGTYIGGTDCLTLSIFTPANAVNSTVLFYIHESDFNSGSGDPAVYGPEYLVPKNVTLVLPNYRLGPLGFMCLKNDTIPGNAGLKDLALALEWTAKNIERFGGDPSYIGVSGDGTSAALAVYLSLSAISKEFVSKVITDSGSALSHWAVDRNPVSTTLQVFDFLANDTNFDIEEELYSGENMQIFLRAAKDVKIRPCVDSDGFLTNTPWNIIAKERFDNITFMIGSANHAGLTRALQHDEASISEMASNFATVLPNDLVFKNDADRNYVGENLKRQYFSDGDITLANSQNISLYHTDASYLGPSVRAARALVTAGATVYLYEFSFVGSLNKELLAIENAPEYGAIRGDIAGYLFTQDGRRPNTGTEEESMVEQVTELWVSFLQTGSPSYGDIEWQPMNETSETWLDIGAESTARTGLHSERLQLWTDLYRDHFIDTYSQAVQTKPAITVAVVFATLIHICYA